ncbi:MAG: DUF1499 domain-containing protein [Pseudomonadota bacterium]
MKRLLWAVALVIGLGLIGTSVFMRIAGDDPALWHVDPASAERTGRPNDYLVAPEGATGVPADRVLDLRAQPAEDLLFLFDAVVRPSSQVKVLAGSVEAGHITYVQRTALFGFPDYITVKAVEGDGGSGLIIWSRSRFGYSDMGVNKTRIDTWLKQIEAP